jgi:endoglucanase Acf2
MICTQCQTKHEYNLNCHACGVRLILSAFPSAMLARRQTDYIRGRWKTEVEPIITEAREKWKALLGK